MHFFLNLHQLKFIFSIILACMMTSIFYRMNLLTLQIKWICPTAPTRPVAILGGFPCTACKIDWSFLVNAILEYFISMVIFLNVLVLIEITYTASSIFIRVWCGRAFRWWSGRLGGFRCFSSTYCKLVVNRTSWWYFPRPNCFQNK